MHCLRCTDNTKDGWTVFVYIMHTVGDYTGNSTGKVGVPPSNKDINCYAKEDEQKKCTELVSSLAFLIVFCLAVAASSN